MGAKFGDRPAWILGEMEKAADDRAPRGKRGTQNHKVDGKREQPIRFGGEVGDSVADGGIHDGLAAERMGNCLAVPFEQKLIDAIVFVEQAQCGFEALGKGVNRRGIETLVVDTVEFENDASVARFREKDARSDEAEKIDQGIERASLFVVLEDAFEVQHGVARRTETGVSFAGSYWRRSFAAWKSKRRICGSVAVALRATKYRSRNMSKPPRRLPRRLNVAAPRHMAKKKSFRSAPRMVRGRESERGTGLILRVCVMMTPGFRQ